MLLGLALAASAIAGCSTKSSKDNVDNIIDVKADGADASDAAARAAASRPALPGRPARPVLSPVSDAKHNLVAVKDPSIVYYNNKYHLFVSTVDFDGAYSMAYVTFPDWDHTADATFYYLDQTPTLVGYHTSPEIFFFAPQNKWYLVFQSGQPQYSTNDDIENPAGWTQAARTSTPPSR